MLSVVQLVNGTEIALIRIVLTGIFGFLVYLVGAVIPSIIIRTISPYEAMRTGEISNTSKRLIRTKGIYSMAFNHFIGKWKRSFLSIVAIALPTSLLSLFVYITIHLKGLMYTTWLGQYVSLEVGPVHYIAMIVALLIAVLATAETMWQNITERQQEIALLKAIGWKNSYIRLLVVIEGMFNGILAAVLGLLLAVGAMWWLYPQFTVADVLFIIGVGIIPVLMGVLGAVIPAEKAARVVPNEGIKGGI